MNPIIYHDRCVLLHGDSAQLGTVLGPNTVDAIVSDPPAGVSFMGEEWDQDKGSRDQWIAWLCDLMRPSFAALKPGAFALVWALPRTSHWTATALEDCGFEICDVHHHIFATGFPKSLDISKAVDDHVGAVRTVIGERPGTGSTTFAGVIDGKGLGPVVQITEPASDEAKRAAGMGTALKPAVEHWILCRKPREGTYASNFIAHGTGGLNIDACRTNERWPAHLSFEHADACEGGSCVLGCPVRLLDEQSGTSATRPGKAPRGDRDSSAALSMRTTGREHKDKGGASRFFFVAKGSRKEKDQGLDHLPMQTGGDATNREEGSAGLGNPRAGAGRTGGARNIHPTVKSVELMKWLVRLVTPPGGVVLDPFAGSGTTGVAALSEGCSFIGCEQGGKDGKYLPIIEGRLRDALARFVK